MTNQEKGLELEEKCYKKLVELGFENWDLQYKIE